MKRFIIIFTLLMIQYDLVAQQKILLYPDQPNLRIGGSSKIDEPPYLMVFPSKVEGSKKSILICPGGGYTALANKHEGFDIAAFFNEHGYHAFMLMYRLNDGNQTGSRFPAQLDDVTRAMQIIRSRAAEFNIDTMGTGIIGFSAGGHLASMGATMFTKGNPSSTNILERQNTRPSFAILVYPVIALNDSFTHKGSRDMLTGKNSTSAFRDSLSTQNRVTAETPPTFLIYGNDDKVVPPENGIVFYEALRKYNIPTTLHIYPHGGHGFGLAPKDPVLNTWPQLAIAWLDSLNVRR
ncbi:alpha/beta hydrolase [Pollutibacter soli]|uniref:alpha/beta hydrolase n=1 Tax=Pollutibacter soli TaxID=3034157 RepID=UPI003013EC37